MRRISVIILVSYCVIGLLGCACLKETTRGLLAISTKEIENARNEAIVKIVDYDYLSCYKIVENKLAEIGSHVYAKRDDLIAVYISPTDTTPAGIFFKEINKRKTQLEIVSPAADTKEYLAEKIFSALEK